MCSNLRSKVVVLISASRLWLKVDSKFFCVVLESEPATLEYKLAHRPALGSAQSQNWSWSRAPIRHRASRYVNPRDVGYRGALKGG